MRAGRVGREVLPKRKRGASVDDMAKRAKEEEEQGRRKDPEELLRDPNGLERKQVSIKLRKTFHDAIEDHRGEKSWSVALHQALEAGLVELGWIKAPK